MKQPRRRLANLTVLGTTQIHLRSPWVAAWWSAALPGFGHLLLGKYTIGFLLIFWEIIINMYAKLNIAMFYSFTGDFEIAKSTLDQRWLLLYTAVYLFSIWDSYRSSVEINKLYHLAQRENAKIPSYKLSYIGIIYLDKKTPWVSVIWSHFMPGLGHLYIHRIITAFFFMVGMIIFTYQSHALEALHMSFMGQFDQTKKIIDVQWFLYIPSIWGFAIYDSYVNTVENNKLFNKEQRDYLMQNFQNKPYAIPFKIEP